MNRPSVALACACLVPPPALLPSDYTPVVYILAVVQAVATVVALFAAHFGTRSVRSPTLRSFLRILPLVVSATFVPMGNGGIWAPALWGLLLGPWDAKAYGLAAILAATLALFLLCALIHRIARSSVTSVPRER